MLCIFRNIFLTIILLFSIFTATAQFAMPDFVCEGATKHYNVDPSLVPGSTYLWRIDGVPQTGSSTNEIDITWNTVGTFLLEVQEYSAFGCSGPLMSGEVFVNPLPVAFASSNSPVCVGNPINLNAQTVLIATYQWTNSDGYMSANQNSVIPSALLSDAGTYSLIVTANGCVSVPSLVAVEVYECIVFSIPEGFSPNGDGINDFFVIKGIERYPANTIIIFNRWGNKVFEASPYQNEWNGTCMFGISIGGDELPIGVYFYVLDLGDGSDIYKGTIYLNR